MHATLPDIAQQSSIVPERAAEPAPAAGPGLGELLAALSPALDLSAGQPAGHALRTARIAQQLGRAMGVEATTMGVLSLAALLKDAGCSAGAAALAGLLRADGRAFRHAHAGSTSGSGGLLLRHAGAGSGPVARAVAMGAAWRRRAEIGRQIAEVRGEQGAHVVRRLGLAEDVAEAVRTLDARWDGRHAPAGDAIPLAARIVALAQFAETLHARAGLGAARTAVARLGGRRSDPRLADAFAVLARDDAFWHELAADGLAQRVVAMAPAVLAERVDDDRFDAIARAFADIADAACPWAAGHSARVARLAVQMAATLGVDAARRRGLHRAALLHDLGRLGAGGPSGRAPTPAESAAMRQHVGHTERILGAVPGLENLARATAAHQERPDGRGYPRGLDARRLRPEAHVLRVADAFDMLVTATPARPAATVSQALQALRDGAATAFDGEAVAALAAVLARSSRS